jgi:hypothetical protein
MKEKSRGWVKIATRYNNTLKGYGMDVERY